MSVRLLQGDCLERLSEVADGSVDMVFADLPYGVTANKWDTPIELSALWAHLLRIGRRNATYVFTATQPFTTTLICSQPKLFRYDLIWEKARAVGFLRANEQPLRAHEHIVCFARKLKIYNPQKVAGKPYPARVRSRIDNYNKASSPAEKGSLDGSRYPRSVQYIAQDGGGALHPTAKPVALLEWLVRTYTNSGDTVLDPTMGAATTGVACINTSRNFIGIEKDATYFDIAAKRIDSTQPPLLQMPA